MVSSLRAKKPEADSEDVRIKLQDLLDKKAQQERQIKDLERSVAALDVLIEIERGETSLPLDVRQIIDKGMVERLKPQEPDSKRGAMIEIVKLKGRAKPKEVLTNMLARGIKVSAHYVHNELSALYKSEVLSRENGQYFLRKKVRAKD